MGSVMENSAYFQDLRSYAKKPFATVNGEPLEPYWVYSEKPFYYKACPIEPNKQVCDDCDVNFEPEGCGAFAGMDAYPSYGWIATDDRDWKVGETRTYTFGFALLEDEDNENAACAQATYTLTAAEPEEPKSKSLFWPAPVFALDCQGYPYPTAA
jgi:hypothetical protein